MNTPIVTSADDGIARIGPNSILRITEVLQQQIGEAQTLALYQEVGLQDYLTHPPQSMVDERDVITLHQQVRRELGLLQAKDISWEAGLLTGDYLLAKRIPKPVQLLLKILPARLASQILLKAISRNAWTFSGSGQFRIEPGQPVRLIIQNNPLCRGAEADRVICDYYAATFERLFRTLVHKDSRVTETECEAMGAAQCVFEIRVESIKNEQH